MLVKAIICRLPIGLLVSSVRVSPCWASKTRAFSAGFPDTCQNSYFHLFRGVSGASGACHSESRQPSEPRPKSVAAVAQVKITEPQKPRSSKMEEKKHMLEYKSAPIGVEVRGVDLKDPELPQDIIEQIKKDVHKHRLLIFKDQGMVSADRHVEISQWFGELESTFYKHPKSPHPDVFRVSNNEKEGCTNVGRTGWHIDGSFMEKPFSFALYHMVAVPKIGNTAFVPLKELVESLAPETRVRWERLWRTDHHFQVVHPLIYPHPVTKDPTICFHLGMTGCFVWDYGTNSERQTDHRETSQLLKEIYNEITKDNNRLVYSHKWEVGDFIISDNLSVGHEATPETQLPVSQVGLRVLHRTTIKGKWVPEK